MWTRVGQPLRSKLGMVAVVLHLEMELVPDDVVEDTVLPFGAYRSSVCWMEADMDSEWTV